MATSKLTEQDVDKLLHMVVRATSRVDPEPDWADLLPAGYTGTPGEDGADVALFFRRPPHLFRLEPGREGREGAGAQDPHPTADSR